MSVSGCASFKDAAEFLCCSRDSIYRLLAEGKLRSSQVRGRRVILWKDLLRFVGSEVPERDESRLLNVSEASRWLTVSRDTCYELLADGSIPSTRVGNRYRIAERHLSDFIGENVIDVKG